jgi:hypothetical protein
MKRQILSTLALAASGLWIASCDSQKVTGTVDETNASAARLLDTAGTPVAGANLLVFQPQDTTGKPVTTGLTLADGSFSLPTVADGLYRVVARAATGKIAVQDSVYTNQGKLQIRTDTVRAPGSLYGVVVLVGDDNPRSVEVSVLGSDASVVKVNEDGTYKLDGLGAGTWKLKFSTSLSGYTNTYVTAKAKATVAVKVDTVDMSYVDIPPVSNLKAVYDTVTGVVRLSWSVPSNVKGIRDIQVLRAIRSSSDDPGVVGTGDTTFADAIYPDWSWGADSAYQEGIYVKKTYDPTTWLYNVRIRTNDGRVGRVAYTTITTVSPMSIAPAVTFALCRPSTAIKTLSDTVGIVLNVYDPSYDLKTITWKIQGITKARRVVDVAKRSAGDSLRHVLDTLFIRAGDIDSTFYAGVRGTDSTTVVDAVGHTFRFSNAYSWGSGLDPLANQLAYLHRSLDSTHHDTMTSIDSTHRDTTVRTDTLRHDTTIFVDTTHRDSVVLSQHARDSIQRRGVLDSLAYLKMNLSVRLDTIRKHASDTTLGDSVALKTQIQLIQHQYDSLSTAPLAAGVGAEGSPLLAWVDPRSWSGSESQVAKLEEHWIRDEEAPIV